MMILLKTSIKLEALTVTGGSLLEAKSENQGTGVYVTVIINRKNHMIW